MNSSNVVKKCDVQKNEAQPGEYKISFQPTNRREYQLHIKVDGTHIEGSPFTVNVINHFDVDNAIDIITSVQRPQGIAINKSGEIIVVEYRKHCVFIFSPTGQKIKSFGTRGSGKDQFFHPCGVAVEVFVTDGRNDRIQKFNSNGEFITSVGKQGKGELEFYIPIGIRIDTHNKKIYVTESDGNRVQILNFPDLTFSGQFGSGAWFR